LKDYTIIVDSREQRPLFKGKGVVIRKLDEGDYATEQTINKLVIERKSPGDLYGSLIQGHKRFVAELTRADLKNKKIYVFVECSFNSFITLNWNGGYFRKLKPAVLAKIVGTFEVKYKVNFVWCKGRPDMRVQIKKMLCEYSV